MSLKRVFELIFLFISINPVIAEELAPITVSASRVPVPIDQVGSSVSVIGAQEINNRQVSFVSDLLRDVPSTTISQSGGAGTLTQLRLRGAESNHTLVMIDGIEANDVASFSEFNFANLVTCGFEQIEVLRGPQSALWGSDALAGVVNLQSKTGSGPLSLESTFNLGSFDTRENCTVLGGGNELHHFSLSGSYFENNGTNISEDGSEDDGFRNTSFNFNYGITPVDNFELNLNGRHVDSDLENDPGSPPTDGNNKSETIQNYFRLGSTLLTFENAWTHQLDISITDTDNEFFTDSIKTFETRGEKLKFAYQTNFFYSTDTTDHTLTLAYERERERFEQLGEASFFGDPNTRQKIYNTGYIGEYQLAIFDQLFLSASVRKDDNDIFDDRTTHRLTAAYSPASIPTRFHAAYGTGVKNPTFTELFGFFPGEFVGNSELEPELSRGWEIGFTHAFTNYFTLGATYFSEELEDEIAGSGMSAINLDGESDRKGVELSFLMNPLESLSFNGSYTYVDSRQPDDTGKTTEVRVPRNTASLVTNYRFLDEKANVNLSISYTDDQFDTEFLPDFTTSRVELSDYTLVNLAGEYQINELITLEGRVENLFDKDYQDVFGFETQGASAHIGLKFNNELF